jgi:hypothetical protein
VLPQRKKSSHALTPVAARRGNQLGVAGWAAVADALERVTCLTSLNGCGQYAAIRAVGLRELTLEKEWELGVWAVRFLERSGATLTTLDVRCGARWTPETRGGK